MAVWVPQSRHVDSIDYNGQELIVSFWNGSQYRYAHVPETTYSEMLKIAQEGGSVGAFLHRRIYPGYPTERRPG